MKILAQEQTEVFEVNFRTGGQSLIDSSCGVHATEKTEFIDTLAEWNKIVPHLTDVDVMNSLFYGFNLGEGDEELIELVLKGEFEPSFYNYPSIENKEDLSKRQYNWMKKHDSVTIERLDKWEELTALHYEDNNNPYPSFHWIEPKSWFSFMPAHRCYEMSYFEKEFGKILYPELDWQIVHTDTHGFAVGLSTDGKFHIEKVFDMSWWRWNKTKGEKEIKKYFENANF